MRPRPSGVLGGALLLALAVAWVLVARPPGTWPLLAWFALLAMAGALLPGLANQVTLSRAGLAAPGFVYALSPSGLLPLAAVVGLAAFTDTVDGAIARRLDRPTRFGGALDPLVDGLFFGGVAVGLAVGGAYPPWLAGVVLARYGLPAAAGAILLGARGRVELRHTPMGQASTVVICALLGLVAVLRGLGQDAAGVVLAAGILFPVGALATFANLAWANRRALSDLLARSLGR
jgi:cardiolipin synthase